MKVCYFISTPSVAGGANRSLLDMIRCLRETIDDYSAIAIMSGHGTMETALQKIGVKCYVVIFANAVKSRTLYRTLGKMVYNCLARKKIRAILLNEKPDIIHNNSLPTTIGMEVARKEKIPYVCHIRENIWDGLGMEFYLPKTVKRVMNNASGVIAISDYILNSYKGFFSNTKTVVLNDGIVIDDYYSPDRVTFENDEIKLLIVGVINPQKGQKEAVEVVERLKREGYNISLTILGADGRWKDSTDYVDKLKAYVKEKQLSNIHFVGPINDTEELRLFRNNFDINLICSSAEGLGRTTIEAMLSGALAIASNAGATPEIVTDNHTGLLYTQGNLQELYEKIIWAIQNREKAKIIAKNGQSFACKRFEINCYCKQVKHVYVTAIDTNKMQ